MNIPFSEETKQAVIEQLREEGYTITEPRQERFWIDDTSGHFVLRDRNRRSVLQVTKGYSGRSMSPRDIIEKYKADLEARYGRYL